ncbi:MAG TPA: hypothetical protein GXZ95_01760 [Mollicutes bacterium]|nr:hypothetical protein [Mollicutes bacterium]
MNILRIPLIVIVATITLCIIFGTIDYFRVSHGKKPLFTYRTVNVSSFDVSMVGFEDIVLPKKDSTEYYGVGYKVSICDNETKNYNFQLGHKQKERCFTTLTCTKKLAENDTTTFEYTFFDGKLYRITTTLLIPSSQIANEPNYETKFMKINDVPGCGGTFNKLNETTYATTQICNIFEMSDSDIEKVYRTNKASLELTRAEIIEIYHDDKDMICE